MRHLRVFLLGILMTAVSCRNEAVRLVGRINCDYESAPVLELVTASGVVAVDTVALNRHGGFKLKIVPPYAGPNLYSFMLDDCRIPLLLSAGERVSLTLDRLSPTEYTIEGSEESQRVGEVKQMMDVGTLKLDSLLNAAGAVSGDERNALLRQYAAEYARLKRNQIQFITANPGSMAAVYALYQRFPIDDAMGGAADNDIVYYRMVADSVRKHYPTSPYLAAVESYVRSVDSEAELRRRMGESVNNPVSYPDLTLPDIVGNPHTLSELQGSIILLDFWNAGSQAAAIRNAELKEIYARCHPYGFEIYQVGLNDSKNEWVNAVHMQQLPWVSVCDFRGLDGYAPRVYNVSAPDNFLISADGDIISHGLTVDALSRRLIELFHLDD